VQLRRLDHVSLNVSDRARSIAWYRDVLGLEQRGEPRRDDWPVFMGELGACVALFQAQVNTPERQPESTGLRHVAFMVGRDDLAGGSFDDQFTFAQSLTETAKGTSGILLAISIPASESGDGFSVQLM